MSRYNEAMRLALGILIALTGIARADRPAPPDKCQPLAPQVLPTDGAEFGFDNIATALKTSPLLLEGYVNAAQRVAAMAVGDPQVRPGSTEHSISREFSQNGYIDGLPLGTVGGTVVASARGLKAVEPIQYRGIIVTTNAAKTRTTATRSQRRCIFDRTVAMFSVP